MIKTNNNSIKYGLKKLTIFAFSLIFIPTNVTHASYGTNIADADYFNSGMGEIVETKNPTPYLRSINPKSTNINTGTRTVTITGGGFVPTSVARVNGSNRKTTFIDSSHLLIQLTGNDTSNADGFFITVWNQAPGGGYSNALSFTINNIITNSDTNTQNNVNDNYNSNSNYSNTTSSTNNTSSNSNTSSNTTNTQSNTNTTDSNSSFSGLASSAILGSSSHGFLPSGLVQWIMLAIIIMIIIILARKVFGAEEEYHAAPLKHA